MVCEIKECSCDSKDKTLVTLKLKTKCGVKTTEQKLVCADCKGFYLKCNAILTDDNDIQEWIKK